MKSLLIPEFLGDSQVAASAGAEPHRESERFKLLLDMTNTLVSNLQLRDLLRAISASIRQVMHCDVVGVWVPNSDQSQLCQLAMDFPESRGFLREDSLRPVAGSNLGTAFTKGKSIVVPKADLRTEFSATAGVETSRNSGYE